MTSQTAFVTTGHKRQFCTGQAAASNSIAFGDNKAFQRARTCSPLNQGELDQTGDIVSNATALLDRITVQLKNSGDTFSKHVGQKQRQQERYFFESFEAGESEKIQQFLSRYGFVCVRTLGDEQSELCARAIVDAVVEQADGRIDGDRWETFSNHYMPEGYSTGVLEGVSRADWIEAGGTLHCAARKQETTNGFRIDDDDAQEDVNKSKDDYDFLRLLRDEEILHTTLLRVDRLTHCTALWNARTDPNLYRVFANLLQTSRLAINIGQVHFMRPRRARSPTATSSRTGSTKEDWRSHIKATFWDNPPTAPATCNGFFGLQILVDADESVGGIELVPGFHTVYDDWLRLLSLSANNKNLDSEDNKERRQHKQILHGKTPSPPLEKSPSGRRVVLPKDAYADRLVNANMRRIPVRAGTVIIIDRRLPFRTYANSSVTKPFCAFEVSMTPLPDNTAHESAARRLRTMAHRYGVRFTALPLLTGHYASSWTRWRREVASNVAKVPYTAPFLSVLGQFLVGLREYDREILQELHLPVYNDIMALENENERALVPLYVAAHDDEYTL